MFGAIIPFIEAVTKTAEKQIFQRVGIWCKSTDYFFKPITSELGIRNLRRVDVLRECYVSAKGLIEPMSGTKVQFEWYRGFEFLFPSQDYSWDGIFVFVPNYKNHII